ncbi:hypothetical protein [Pseudaminobacter sp. NGMCC 1.201702]|uniref:hypothetical protein n=1 Tax=Pseudaminobacter sp. NGMCC 1.201702 TaxID=3391825 RepID=UPI0039EECE50
MTYVSHSSTFARTEALPFDRLISRLHSASKYPLRITCFGVATFIDDDPDAEAISFDHTLRIAERRSHGDAIAEAERCIAEGDFGASGKSAWTFAPRIVAILDAEGGLVAAGEVRIDIIRWSEPVSSDGEARKIVTTASRLRGQAFKEAVQNSDAARELRFSASILESRLVDKFWREPTRTALALAA